MVLGPWATGGTSGSYSVTIGPGANTNGKYAIAIGSGANATAQGATSIGYSCSSTATYSAVLGGYDTSNSTSKRVYIGSNSTNYTTSIGGVTTWSNLSDRRDKFNIKSITNSLEFVNSLNPVTFQMNDRLRYKYTDDESNKLLLKYEMTNYDKEAHARGDKASARRNSGFLAQEVYESLKSVYGSDNYANIVNINSYNDEELGIERPVEDIYSISMSNIIPFLTGAIQELSSKLDEATNKINALENTIAELKFQSAN